MDTHIIVRLVIIGVLVACWLFLVVWTYVYVTGKFNIRFQSLTADDLATAVRDALTAKGLDPTWLIARGFEPCGGYRIIFSQKAPPASAQLPTIVIWKQADEHSFLFVTQMPEPQIDFDTPLKDGAIITSNAKHSLIMLPEPGIWRQAFPSLDAPALYELHWDALAYIEQELRQLRDKAPSEPADLAKSALFGAIESIRRQPYWPLRIPYWTFLALRQQRCNKTIREQVE